MSTSADPSTIRLQPLLMSNPSAPLTSKNVEFSDWSNELLDRRSVSEEEQNSFKQILADARSASAGQNPQQFLDTLSPQQMEVLRKAHTLADSINVSRLDYEGAYNLLQPPGEAKDLNNDGQLGVGIGKGWVFPPPNAPAAVKEAWDAATADLTEGERMLAMAPFMTVNITANIVTDAQGRVTSIKGPDDPGYRNAFADADFSYQQLVSQILAQNEAFKGAMTQEQYQRDQQFLTQFLEALEQQGAA